MKPSAGTVDQVLMKFVVTLVTDDAFRGRYHDPAKREALMEEHQLSDEARKAIRTQSATGVNRLINQQIVSTHQPRKGRGGKAAAPKRAKAAKRPAAKKR